MHPLTATHTNRRGSTYTHTHTSNLCLSRSHTHLYLLAVACNTPDLTALLYVHRAHIGRSRAAGQKRKAWRFACGFSSSMEEASFSLVGRLGRSGGSAASVFFSLPFFFWAFLSGWAEAEASVSLVQAYQEACFSLC